MIQRSIKAWRRFRGDEDGSAMLIEFAILSPLLFGCLLMSVEMSFYAIRHMLLDRGLDMTVRYIRLNTNTPMTHQTIKDKICESAIYLEDCSDTLRLEMGYPLYGHELNEDTTPAEAGFAKIVKLAHDQVGRDALAAAEPRKALVALAFDGRRAGFTDVEA